MIALLTFITAGTTHAAEQWATDSVVATANKINELQEYLDAQPLHIFYGRTWQSQLQSRENITKLISKAAVTSRNGEPKTALVLLDIAKDQMKVQLLPGAERTRAEPILIQLYGQLNNEDLWRELDNHE